MAGEGQVSGPGAAVPQPLDFAGMAAFGAFYSFANAQAVADEWKRTTERERGRWRMSADAAIMAGPNAPSRLAAGNTKLREENAHLREQLHAIKQLAEQGIATGLIDSQALLDATGNPR